MKNYSIVLYVLLLSFLLAGYIFTVGNYNYDSLISHFNSNETIDSDLIRVQQQFFLTESFNENPFFGKV